MGVGWWRLSNPPLAFAGGRRLRYLLTDMQREVRRFTRELAEKRGRPFHLAVRVCPSIEGSMRTGYDVPVWIVRPRPPL